MAYNVSENITTSKHKGKYSLTKNISDTEQKELINLLYDDFLSVYTIDDQWKEVLKKSINKTIPITKAEYNKIKKWLIRETGGLPIPGNSTGYIDEEDIQNALNSLHKDQWSQKEKIEKIPELEEKNFRISMTKREKREDGDGIFFKVKLPERDVREYMKWKFIWEQLFTYESAIRETKNAGKKMPATRKKYRDILQKKYKWNYNSYRKEGDFLSWEKICACGTRDQENYVFDDVGDKFDLRCEDGTHIFGDKYEWHYGLANKKSLKQWRSVRCVK